MRNLIKTFIVITLLIIGALVGLMIDNVPYITLKGEVSFGEVANFVVALVLAIIIPVGLTKWLDNQRHVKDFLVEEVKMCIAGLLSIKQKIDGCYTTSTTQAQDQKEIMYLISTYEMKVNSLKEQLEISYNKESSGMRNELFVQTIEYWKSTTDGDLMKDGFTVDHTFCKQHNVAFTKLDAYLRRCVHLINRF